MLFNSFEFLLFLPLVFLLYWGGRSSIALQNTILLVASYFFYGWWDVRFLFLIAVTTVVDFNVALLIRGGATSLQDRLSSSFFLIAAFLIYLWPTYHADQLGDQTFKLVSLLAAVLLVTIWIGPRVLGRFSEQMRMRAAMGFSIFVNLGILAFFKYFNFFTDSFAVLYQSIFGLKPSMVTLSIVLPVGISFYTFQSMSYAIDVYRKQLEPTRNIVDFGAYLSFFPQLVAGPIERGKNLLPQFQRQRSLTLDGVKEGLWLIFWGLYKKVVIADQLALLVNSVFNPHDLNAGLGSPEGGGLMALIAIYAFAFQIYADFSGYSDIARGCAKLLGFNLMLNFNLPYFSKNPSEFWLRWHISLSSWLRDYLYIPLGGNRGGTLLTYRNLFLTMLLGGLWHGASWTFVLWGAYQGAVLVVYRLLGKESAGEGGSWFIQGLNILWMFQLTCIGWLIFRAQNLNTITSFLHAIAFDMRFHAEGLAAFGELMFYIWPLLIFQIFQRAMGDTYIMPRLHWFAQLNVWLFILLSILILGSTRESEFIYFAF